MIKKASILTVSVIAVMAVCSAHADIASTTYVDTQVQSVDDKLTAHAGDNDIHVTSAEKSAWNAKQDRNIVTATGDELIADSDTMSSTAKYPSMATMNSAIGEALSDTAGDVTSMQNTMVKHAAGTAVGSATTPVYVDTNGNVVAITSYSGTAARATADAAGNSISSTYATKGELSQATTDLSTEISGKQAKSTADYQVGKSGGGWTTLSADQIAAINSGATSGLIGKISTNETAINTLNGDATKSGSVANKINSALTSYSTTAQMNTALDAKADKATIGTVDNGKTVVEMINDAKTAATYDDTALAGRVTANETAIGTINNSNVMKSGIDSTKVAQIATNASNITTLQNGKQDKITAQAPLSYELVDGLATVAHSGSYNDLSNKPTLGTAAAKNTTDTYSATGTDPVTGKAVASAISGKANTADLAAVATSGSYNDLSNKPSIPAAQVNSDWNATSGVAQILNKPTIPTVNNGSLTITQNGGNSVAFTANQSGTASVDITAAKVGAIPAPTLTQLSSTGTLVLTAKQGDGNAVVYAWEEIGR